MADWRKLALEAILADGKVDEVEVKVLKKELTVDGKIDRDGVKFLNELRNLAQKKAKTDELAPAFEKLFFKAIEDSVLVEGKVATKDANWLRSLLYADNKIDAAELKFLAKLKKGLTGPSPAFDKLYEEASGGAEPAKTAAPAKKPAAPPAPAKKPAAPAPATGM
jgi:uncharacterized tellurite resistance protein B-like protein